MDEERLHVFTIFSCSVPLSLHLGPLSLHVVVEDYFLGIGGWQCCITVRMAGILVMIMAFKKEAFYSSKQNSHVILE